MKKSAMLSMLAGAVTGAVAAVAVKKAVDKVVEEIKSEMGEQSFVSPEGDRFVTLSFGSSATAKGLTYIRVTAGKEAGDDACKLVIFAGKNAEAMSGEWLDNDHFRLLVGSGKRKQCCDVTFDEKLIKAIYYLSKKV